MPTSSSKRLALVAVASLLLIAGKKPNPYEPAYAPPPPAQPANGAIFQASRGYAALTSGTRASMVGDLLTIVLVERTQASKSASSKLDSGGGFSLTPPTTGACAGRSPGFPTPTIASSS